MPPFLLARFAPIAALALLAAPPAWSQGYELQRIAAKGDPAPRTGGSFQNFQSVVTNAAGDVVFTATWEVASADVGYFIYEDGALRTIAFPGDAGPPGLGGTHGDVWSPGSLGGGGVFAFPGRLSDSLVGDGIDGLFLDVHGVQSALHLEGDPAPGAPDQTFREFACPSVNESGAIAFRAVLLDETGSSSMALFVHDAAGTRRIVTLGDPAPASVGGEFTSYIDCPYLDAAGRVLFFAYLYGASADQGLFVASESGIEVLTLSGAPAPGSGGGHYVDFSFGNMAHAGGIAAFRASIGGSATSYIGLFRIAHGVHAPLAVNGQPLPPALGSGVFSDKLLGSERGRRSRGPTSPSCRETRSWCRRSSPCTGARRRWWPRRAIRRPAAAASEASSRSPR